MKMLDVHLVLNHGSVFEQVSNEVVGVLGTHHSPSW